MRVREREEVVETSRLILKEHSKTKGFYEGMLLDMAQTLWIFGIDKRNEIPCRLIFQPVDIELTKTDSFSQDPEEEFKEEDFEEAVEAVELKQWNLHELEDAKPDEHSFKILLDKIPVEEKGREGLEFRAKKIERSDVEKTEMSTKCKCMIF
jgi:hypothetical protein